MIDINLVPVHLREKKKKGVLAKGINIPVGILVGSGGGLLLLLLMAHIYFLYVNFERMGQYKKLEESWKSISAEKKETDALLAKMKALKKKYEDIDAITKKHEIIWSKKLNILSDTIAKGIWIRRISLSDSGVLTLEGSAIARQLDEMTGVHTFSTKLKKEEAFMEHFTRVDLGSISRRRIKKVEVADFSIKAK